MIRFRPLAAFLIATALIVVLLQWLNFNPNHDPVDEWLLLLAAGSGLLGLTIMVLRTEQWTIRALGVFGYIASVSLLFILFERAAIWHDRFTSLQLDIVRAFLLAGAPLWLVGQVQSLVDFKKRKRRVM